MHGRKNYMSHFSGIGVAILLVACLSQFQPVSPGRVRAGDRLEATPIAPDLVTAIRDADAQAVRKLIDDHGVDVNARDAEGNTPLILASFYASPKFVALLLEKGAEANAVNKVGVTALIRAATDYEKTRLLVDAGAKVRVRTAGLGNTPLILAARRAGNSRAVKLLLERGAEVTERNNVGISPIISGAASGDLETVRLLLGVGAEADDFPRSRDPGPADAVSGFRTPLMWAAYHNGVPMVRLLLEHGADPNKSTYFGSPLSQACWNDGFEAADLLIDRGANVNARDAVADFTPLHWAAGNETLRPHLVKLLLGCGADPNAAGGEHVDAFGLVPQTPRLIAEKNGRTGIVDALAAAGAKEPPRPEKTATPHRVLLEKLETSTVIASAEKALAALQTTAARSREAFLGHISKQDCTSCHQQYLPMAAVGHARNRSIRFDQEAARKQLDLIVNPKNSFEDREFVAQTLFHPDPAHTFGYKLLGSLAEGVPPSAITDGQVHHLVTVQASDGRWMNNLPRPPMMSNDVTATALSIHAIKHYGWKGREAEFAASIEHARGWLRTAVANSNEEATFQLLGLYWADESSGMLNHLTKSLLQRQRKDGGWSQLPTLESDAYATGQALYALSKFVKDPTTDPAWQRGLRFLLERQEEDGSWHVARRAFPFQPSMNSGFPHNRDSWISAAATSWAALALTQVAPVGSASGKPALTQQASPVRAAREDQKIDFAGQIKPLLERSCAACHGGEKPRGLFRIDSRDAILKGGASGDAAIVPGHSEKSPLVDYVSGRVTDFEMPPRSQREKFPALRAEDVAQLRAWIDQGAEWPKNGLLSPPR
jgi:ankyrin repeat protein/mono/diheme cytochrome c family protein